jgi:hypothetical protein
MNPIMTQQFGQQPDFFSGRPAQLAQINKFNPQQQNALSSLLGQASQGMKNPYQGFEPIEARARSQFQKNTIPGIAERFTSLGDNAISSGAFASQLGEAGAGLEEGLAALRSQYGLQNRGQLLRELGLGLTPENENFYQPREEGGWESLIGPLLQLLLHGGAAAATGGASLPYSAGLMGGQFLGGR